MKIEVISQYIIADGSTKFILRTNKENLQFIGYVLETFEGYCNYSTIDKNKKLLQVISPKAFSKQVRNIIDFLKKTELKIP